MKVNNFGSNYSFFQKTTSAAPLAVFRLFFGVMLFASLVRFSVHGWIDELYIQPPFHFTFFGFGFIKPLGDFTYLLFAITAISAIFVAIGYQYRVSIISLFLGFTYIELMDKATYLNHYYFISLLCFILIFLPAHHYFSVDSYLGKVKPADSIPAWCIVAIQLLVFILYFYAGLAKINSDWLMKALPLKIWLPARNDIPFIGKLFNYSFIPYVFSWFSCMYDLSIVFFLSYSKTRYFAYFTVVVFHIFTAILFPIGMFPYIMIVTALLFFPADFHQKIIDTIGRWLSLSSEYIHPKQVFQFSKTKRKWLMGGFMVFYAFQFLFPFRYMLYPNALFWSEEGYRFSWRVMLMEKAGNAQFKIVDQKNSKLIFPNNEDFLTPLQEKMMATQPDMILQYAHYLQDFYIKEGFQNPAVFVDSYVTLNGRMGQALIDPSVNLASEFDSFKHKTWILPFNDEIKGF